MLDKDYMTVSEEQIHTIQPQINIFDGKIVYVHSQFAQENNLTPTGAMVTTYKDLVASRKPTTIRGLGGG